jgi:hypothetical protein
MTVTWSTQLLATKSYVEFNIRNEHSSLTENATVSKFIDGSSAHRVLYMYRATMKNLTMNTTYGTSKFLYLILFYDQMFSLSSGKSGWFECELYISNNT